ncbi:MAG: TIGR02594 family protein [Pseudomonadota bacterium]
MLQTNWSAVQRRLKTLGFCPGEIDGVRGPLTDQAIVNFKRSVGLRARPYFGPLTHDALFADEEDEAFEHHGYINNARALLGVHERRNHSRLTSWFTKTVRWIDPREIAWCGAFVETCMRMWGEDVTVENPLGARNWLSYGKDVAPQTGTILVFWRVSRRDWRGHVGFYWGEDKTHFHVLGGNQSNAVTITRIAKSRLLGARMPFDVPETGKTVEMTARGVPISENEA